MEKLWKSNFHVPRGTFYKVFKILVISILQNVSRETPCETMFKNLFTFHVKHLVICFQNCIFQKVFLYFVFVRTPKKGTFKTTCKKLFEKC